MAKINSKIDKALRKEVIENGVFLGHIASFGFNCNVYLYKNEVYRENFTINDDFIITDFARWTWYMVKSNITQFHPNEPYAEELIEYMTLYEHSLYLSNKKYREIAKEQFAELKKDYQESGLLDDINALLKKSKSKTFRYSKYESEKNVGKSLKESVDKTFFDFMCDKDFFKGISKQVTKKEKCQFDFYKTPNSYTWLITYKEGESLSINMDERTNDIFIHVTKNGKSGKDFKFPQLTFNDSVDELLDIIIRYVQGNFDLSWYESKKSTRKSLKEDSLDDIIPMGHSEYFDTLVEFFKHNDVPIRISHTAGGGKICYVENDMEFITVIFKSPKRGYELLKMLEMYGDGSTFLSRGKGGAWYSNHVPLEEVYVWDMDKDEFVNYKGKVLKNVDYDDIVESKKNVRKAIEESMNLDYSDFDYKKFENWIIRYLEDYGCEVNTVEIICDDYGYDVEINIENAENLPSRISDKDYGAFIFDAMYTTNCLYLKMPIVRAMKIAEKFSPKVLKVNDDSILIGDKNSDTKIWLDVWTDNDGDEDYTEWDYNKQSFNLNNYEDMVQKYLQQIDDFFYILDGEVSDNF